MQSVNFFWDGKKPGRFELMNIKSFLANDHKVNLFTYNKTCFSEIKHNNFNILDANEILSVKKLFYYKGNGDCPKNSVCGFSDLFRYALLYKIGGWYADVDTTCLKNLNDNYLNTKEIILKPHDKFKAICNMIKIPPKTVLMKDLFNITKKHINSENSEYVKPLKLFYNKILTFNYNHYIVSSDLFGNDNIKEIYDFLNNFKLSKESITNRYSIHWCSTAITTGKWDYRVLYDLNNPSPDSLLSYLYFKYE